MDRGSGRFCATCTAPIESAHRALAESIRYIRDTPLVRWVFAALAVVMLASAVKAPLEPLFILRTLGRRPDALGLVGGAWGVGMVLGSLAAPSHKPYRARATRPRRTADRPD